MTLATSRSRARRRSSTGWSRAACAHACLSPGSRSTPLALALARDPRVQVHVHLDERSSAFFALGLAKATPSRSIVATTSGTAAAELLPAVVEASQSRMPLVLLTADRPPRLRGTGANQTIDQPGLFGEYVRASIDLPVPDDGGTGGMVARRPLARRLDAMAADPPGPVHVNCPFEEPLTPSEDVGLARRERRAGTSGRPDRRPSSTPTRPNGWPVSSPARAARSWSADGPCSSPGSIACGRRCSGWPIARRADLGRPPAGAGLAAGQALIGSAWAGDPSSRRRDPVRRGADDPSDPGASSRPPARSSSPIVSISTRTPSEWRRGDSRSIRTRSAGCSVVIR